ncbi:hypothetical protein B1H29_30290 [Streptomyces pactum]|uniref:Uncharacterized protein n=1 Tax=Streptomyces pactum TaxID=68249 RepID=A0A1S6JFS2_9ACTN|nr:hypothetical protein B1H29_30290 [Streptomyces pactum]
MKTSVWCVPRQLHHTGGLRRDQAPPALTRLVINTPRPHPAPPTARTERGGGPRGRPRARLAAHGPGSPPTGPARRPRGPGAGRLLAADRGRAAHRRAGRPGGAHASVRGPERAPDRPGGSVATGPTRLGHGRPRGAGWSLTRADPPPTDPGAGRSTASAQRTRALSR